VPQCDSGAAAVGGSLCLPVPRGRLPACGDRATVVVNGRTSDPQVIVVARWLTSSWLHSCQVGRVA
jgi:hypothetical protein